jgi:DNA-binding beta-propeller fold protein YncE
MKFKLFISTILVVLLGAVLLLPIQGQEKSKKQGNKLSAPAAMALYVSNSVANTITMYDAGTGAFIRTLVQGGSVLQAPNGFAFAPDGSIYVSGEDSNNIVHYNGKTGQLIDVLDPTNIATVSGPQGMSFGPDGLLYVVSQNNDKVVRYDIGQKKFLDKFCDVVLPNTGTTKPINVDFGPDGNLYVGTYSGHKHLKYQGPARRGASPASRAASTAAPGTLLGVFDSPPDMLLGATAYASGDFASYMAQSGQTSTDQHYFVDVISTEGYTGKVVEYTQAGAYVRTFIDNGSGGLVLPGGIAFGPDGNLYVANILVDENFKDTGSTILRFDGKTGAPMGTFVAAGNGLGVPFAMRFGPR